MHILILHTYVKSPKPGTLRMEKQLWTEVYLLQPVTLMSKGQGMQAVCWDWGVWAQDCKCKCRMSLLCSVKCITKISFFPSQILVLHSDRELPECPFMFCVRDETFSVNRTTVLTPKKSYCGSAYSYRLKLGQILMFCVSLSMPQYLYCAVQAQFRCRCFINIILHVLTKSQAP